MPKLAADGQSSKYAPAFAQHFPNLSELTVDNSLHQHARLARKTMLIEFRKQLIAAGCKESLVVHDHAKMAPFDDAAQAKPKEGQSIENEYDSDSDESVSYSSDLDYYD